MMIRPIECPPQPAPAAPPDSLLRLAMLLVMPVALLVAGVVAVATPEHIAAMDPLVWLADRPLD
jgi:peptidoglycan/LPS O-acetylase OafA/YrhL